MECSSSIRVDSNSRPGISETSSFQRLEKKRIHFVIDNLINGECLSFATQEMFLEMQMAPKDRNIVLEKCQEALRKEAAGQVSIETAVNVSLPLPNLLAQYENQLQQMLKLKRKVEEREQILAALTR
jgi:hypothetical protein